jgi:hypothetical protein
MGCERQQVTLHIGHGKTGSSYIQSSLALSAERLREAGIEYPELRPFARAKQGYVTSGNLGHAKTFVHTVTEVADRHAKAGHLLFSSEWVFGRIAADGESLATLQKSFDVTVILFTREFLAYTISSYGQAVKRGGCTESLGKYLAEDRHPLRVLQVLQAAERAGCRIVVFNYSRHSDHLLDVFAGACGIDPETLVPPPVARVNRSLDEAELALIRRLNAVLGSARKGLVGDALCERLPLHPSGPPRITREEYEQYRALVAPIELTINQLLPPSERYGTDEPILIEDGDGVPGRVMGFTEAQMDVLAETLGQEIVGRGTSKTNETGLKSGLARMIRSMAGRLW